MTSPEGKTCTVCHTFKLYSEFGRRAAMSDGHRSECKACGRKAAEAYRTADPEATRERYRRHYQKHRDKRIANASRWRAENPEKARETQLNARAKKRTVTWAKALVTEARCRSRKNGIAFDLDEAWVLALFERQKGCCFWYHIPLAPADVHRNPLQPSLDRIDPSVGYLKSNVVLACAAANLGRNSTPADEFSLFASALEANFKTLPQSPTQSESLMIWQT